MNWRWAWLSIALVTAFLGCSFTGSNDEKSAQWYNRSYLRQLFGDFDKTPRAFVIDKKIEDQLQHRGEYLVRGPGACGLCHAGRRGDPQASLSGGQEMEDSFGRVHAANITADKQTGIGRWNIFEIMRALRASIDREGRPLSNDLHSGYRWMSDQDAKAIAVYLLALRPVQNEVPRRRLGGFERNSWGILPQHSELAGYVPTPMTGDNRVYGRYLTENVARCASCHTWGGEKFAGRESAPSASDASFIDVLSFSNAVWRFRNVPAEDSDVPRRKTPAPAVPPPSPTDEGDFPVAGPDIRGSSVTGLAEWSKEDIVRYLSTGDTPTGETRSPKLCPWAFFRNMTDGDKRAVAEFLKSL